MRKAQKYPVIINGQDYTVTIREHQEHMEYMMGCGYLNKYIVKIYKGNSTCFWNKVYEYTSDIRTSFNDTEVYPLNVVRRTCKSYKDQLQLQQAMDQKWAGIQDWDGIIDG